MEFDFDEAPEIGNRYGKWHWARKGRTRKTWADRIMAQCGLGRWHRNHICDDKRPRRCKVFITIWRPRLQDEENFKWSLKPVYDALRHAGFIWQDSPRWVVRDDMQTLGPKPGRIRITVIEESEVPHAAKKAKTRILPPGSDDPPPF